MTLPERHRRFMSRPLLQNNITAFCLVTATSSTSLCAHMICLVPPGADCWGHSRCRGLFSRQAQRWGNRCPASSEDLFQQCCWWLLNLQGLNSKGRVSDRVASTCECRESAMLTADVLRERRQACLIPGHSYGYGHSLMYFITLKKI